MMLAMVGLGRQGSNMARRLLGAGQEGVVFDLHPRPGLELGETSPLVARSVADLVVKLGSTRVF